MKYQHQLLAAGKWATLSFSDQMANIGSEVIRAINWKKKGNLDYSKLAFYRALELIDLTRPCLLTDGYRLKEVSRVREVLVDYFVADNQYCSSDLLWERYFLAFNYLAALRKTR
jgi:hypothetical protein